MRDETWIDRIRGEMKESVERQLMADVPLGTQLSGGVDSSWVSSIAASLAPGMKSFTVGFEDDKFDETREANIVAEAAGLEYHEILSDSKAFSDSLARIIWLNDEPLTHANSLEIHNLCLYAKNHVKVLLTGEGADELFGGYPRYFLCNLNEMFRKFPTPFWGLMKQGADLLSRGRGKKPSEFLGLDPFDLVLNNSAFCDRKKVSWLMDVDDLDISEREKSLANIWSSTASVLDNLLQYEFRSYLQPILLRQDKMSMGASLEARVPILDNRVVDLAFAMPAKLKIKHLKPKYLFKQAALCDLPKSIVHKRKVGFGVPVGRWLREGGPLADMMDHLMDDRRSLPGVLPDRLEKLVHDHRAETADHQDVLWPLLNLLLWRDVYLVQGVKA